jgi:cold shock CspA family protein
MTSALDPGPFAGVVAAYDTTAGYGTVRADDGRTWWFHCTAVADGSRHIDEGTRVVFRVVPGHRGQGEGVDLVPAAPTASS